MSKKYYNIDSDTVSIVLSALICASAKGDTFSSFLDDNQDFIVEETEKFKKSAKYIVEEDVYVIEEEELLDFIDDSCKTIVALALKELADAGLAQMGWSDENGGEVVYSLTEEGKKLGRNLYGEG